MPHRKEDQLKKIQAAYHVLSQRYMRKPRIEEICEFLNLQREEVLSILTLSEQVASLDSETLVDGGSLYDVVLDYSYSPDRSFMEKIVQETLEKLLGNLLPREQDVLRSRFGLQGAQRFTLKEIADRLEVSPETVRQIELRSIRKLKEAAGEYKDILLQDM